MKTKLSIIKWSGSKRSQAKDIVARFPSEIETYFEPFMGTCIIFRELIASEKKIKVKRCVLSDKNESLVQVFKMCKDDPEELLLSYAERWGVLNSFSDMNEQRAFYEEIRTRYNETHDPRDFVFLMRTCVNGLPRYNKKGEFNTGFHLNRGGMNPREFAEIVREWGELLNSVDVEFRCRDYSESFDEAKEGDFMYLDPPYRNANGVYFGDFNHDEFFEKLSDVRCAFALSFDGFTDEASCPVKGVRHELLNSGKSSFRKLFAGKDEGVHESLFLKSCETEI